MITFVGLFNLDFCSWRLSQEVGMWHDWIIVQTLHTWRKSWGSYLVSFQGRRQSILHAHASAFKISLWINKAYVLSMKQALFFCLGVYQRCFPIYILENLDHGYPAKSWNQNRSWNPLPTIPKWTFSISHEGNGSTCHLAATTDQL